MIKQDEQRRDFLRKIPVALVSLSAFSFLGFRKKERQPEFPVDSLSKQEADEMIRISKSPASGLKPAPPPVRK